MKTIAALLAVGMAISLVGTSTAEDVKKGPPTVAGIVKSLDSQAITLEGRTKEGKEVAPPQTFELAKDVKVTEGADAKTLADVKTGASVVLILSEDKKLVTAIALAKKQAEGKYPTVAGIVKSLDSQAITLEGRTKEGKEVAPPQTFELAKDVKVTEGADAKTLADVKTGASVVLILSEDKKLVTAIALPKKEKKTESD
jgi:ribosomal 50S subunit-recycling heat shock protein